MDNLSTGNSLLDEQLRGGVPPGSVVALRSRPASQAELLLYELATVRETLYLTFDRTEAAVQSTLDAVPGAAADVTIRRIGADATVDDVVAAVGSLPDGGTLVLDPVTRLEAGDREAYVGILNEVRAAVEAAGGVAVLNAPGQTDGAAHETTEYMADVVFQVATSMRGEQIENKLSVPKFRRGRALTETVNLRLTDIVEIDTSRDIG
ncbi:DUF7125 family protein [Halomarina rubra]|uniref:Transcriptional regulator n=1 Tax=Halomarina rubra TaxID=2071873 RepID=A0ABD6AQT9_9EURY|nr:transcriptional regulator [Halomarina rubra]